MISQEEIERLPSNGLSQKQITKIVEYIHSNKTRDNGMGKNTQLVLQEVFKFSTIRCVWDGKTIEQDHRGRGNKAYCNKICHKRGWEFNNRLEKIRLTQPKFYLFFVKMLKEGIPADKLDLYLRDHKKEGFAKQYSREDFL